MFCKLVFTLQYVWSAAVNAVVFTLQVVQSVGDKSLNSIDDKIIVAGGFLKKLNNEPGKLDCLKAFAESLDIVEWILKETKGISGPCNAYNHYLTALLLQMLMTCTHL
jgi:hypothetical protein